MCSNLASFAYQGDTDTVLPMFLVFLFFVQLFLVQCLIFLYIISRVYISV